MSKYASRALLWLAGLLLTLQGVVIGADLVMDTWIFDEALSFGINAALVWIIAKQRNIMKGANA